MRKGKVIDRWRRVDVDVVVVWEVGSCHGTEG